MLSRRDDSEVRSGNPRGRRGRCGGAVLVLSGLAIGMSAGCADEDTRITLTQLRDMEVAQTRAREVVDDVPREKLALSDVRPYQYRPGDELMVEVTGLRDDLYLPTMFRVRVHDDQSITLPGVGPIEVGGLSPAELEEKITAAFVPSVVKRPITVFVELQRPQETTVLVTGAARAPGLVRLRENQRNVLYALAGADGFVDSSTGEIRVVPARPQRPEMTYDLRDPTDVRLALLAPPLESGDTVVVTSAEPSVIYLVGLVNAPGPIPVPREDSVSLVRALAAAGGLVDFLDPQEATLWRQLPDGQQVRVKLEIAKIASGEAVDIALRAGDVLEIPHTAHTRFRAWVAQNIRIGPFGVTAVYDPVADYRARILARENNNGGGNLFQRTLLNSLGTGIADVVVPPVSPP